MSHLIIILIISISVSVIEFTRVFDPEASSAVTFFFQISTGTVW